MESRSRLHGFAPHTGEGTGTCAEPRRGPRPAPPPGGVCARPGSRQDLVDYAFPVKASCMPGQDNTTPALVLPVPALLVILANWWQTSRAGGYQ